MRHKSYPVVDRAGLEQRTCECYAVVKKEYDRLLPATSNAVERSNRRFRKAQRSVYSVRTAAHVRQRIALDMKRDHRAPERNLTLCTLHAARTDTG